MTVKNKHIGKFMKKIVLMILSVVAIGLANTAFASETTAPVWQETFDSGIAAAHTYFKDGNTAKLEATAEGTIRATLRGERTLEGFRVTATGLPANRMVTVKARVRGNGQVLVALNSASGWLYMPATTLTDQWQTLVASKTTAPKDSLMTVYFISPQKQQPGAVFEVDGIQIFASEPMSLADEAVPARKFEAEAFTVTPGAVSDDPQASGRQYAAHGNYLRLEGIVFPRTSQSVSVYARVRTGAQASRLELITARGGQGQTLRRLPLETSKQWQWVTLPSVSAEEVGSTMAVAGRVTKAGDASLAIDCIVLSTDAELTPAELDAAQGVQTDGPMAYVVKTAEAPVIDGKPDDACWADAAAITDFVTYNAFTPLAQPTKTRLLYDATHLYVLVEAREPVLDVVSQRRHELFAKITDRDDRVLRDDSFMLLVSPEGGDAGYEFSINTLGTLLDARSQMSDLWGTRDVTWNANAKVVAAAEDGYWVAEMAIPLADLGVTGQVDGQQWQAILARVAQTRGELGTWNHSLVGAHAPATLGTLVFGAQRAGVSPVSPLTSLEPGVTGFDVQLQGPVSDGGASGSGVYLWSQVRSLDGSVSQDVTYLSRDAAKQTHDITVAQAGSVQVRWIAMDAATLEPIYASPVIHTSVQSSLAKLTLSTDGAYRVVVNDQVIASGARASDVAVRLPLRQGENVIAVEAATGAAQLKLDGPTPLQTPVRWRVNDAATPDAVAAKLDDRTWPLASAADGAVGQTQMLGQQGKPAVFRHTMLQSHTRIWPKPHPAFYVAANSVEDINFTAMGLPGKQQMDWQMYIAVPEEYDVLGSTGHYGRHVAKQPLFECEPAGQITIEGAQMQRYRVRASKPVVPDRHYRMSVFQLMVRIADETIASPGSRSKWYYWTQANDGSMTEPPASFTVEALPALAGKQPEKFAIQLWGSIHVMDQQDLREPLLATLQAAGINEFCTADRWSADNGDTYGIRTQLLLSYHTWSNNVTGHLKEHPEDRLVDREGNVSNANMCMTQLLGSGWDIADEHIAKQLEERQPDIAQYDYEYPPMTGPHSCFCDRCLAAFRSYHKLPADAALSPAIVQEQYVDQWVDFMAYRVALLMVKMKASVHAARPGTKFSVYSGYNVPDNAARYGLDWNYLGQMRGADIFACGYGRPVQGIKDTLKAADGIPTLLGVLLHPYLPTLDQPVTPASKARLLRRAIDATGGVLIYKRSSMDGRWWYAIGEISRLIATYEDLFLHARPQAIAGQDPASVQVLRGKDASLVCVMNDTGKARAFTFTLPTELGSGKAFYTGEAVNAGASVQLTLEPGEVAVYAFGSAAK